MRIIYTFLLLTIFTQTFGQKSQIVKSNDIKINGNLLLFTSKNDFIAKIGKVEKIVEDFPECSNYDEEASKGTKFYIYTKKGIQYYVYNKKADFQEINLKDNSNNYISFGKYKISNKTTINDLKNIFPIAYKNYKKEENASLFRLKFNKKWDDEVQISIENGKVSAVYYWTPC